MPCTETFDSYADGAVPPGWVNATAGKLSVTTLDGQKVLTKAPDNTIFKRIRAFIGPVDWSNYTFEADVRGTTQRRQMTDIGITGAALLARALRQLAAAEDRAVGAGNPAVGRGAVRVEGRHLVSPEAARREHARRQGARAWQGVGEPGSPSRPRGRSTRPIRSATTQRRARLVRRRGVRRLSRQPEDHSSANQ